MVVTAADLADADIVLTNYDVLKKDVNFEVGESSGRSGRGSKYPVFPTPLTRLTWWRVIVDEAQMIEGASSKAAVMANHLRMVNRWCVTGTPISKGLDDIYGLALFLQARLWFTATLCPQLVTCAVCYFFSLALFFQARAPAALCPQRVDLCCVRRLRSCALFLEGGHGALLCSVCCPRPADALLMYCCAPAAACQLCCPRGPSQRFAPALQAQSIRY